MEQYIVGKWYKNLTEKGYYGKFKSLKESENRFECSEYICLEEKTYDGKDKNIWFYNSDGHQLLTDLSKIAHLLPSNHPDLQQNSLISNIQIW